LVEYGACRKRLDVAGDGFNHRSKHVEKDRHQDDFHSSKDVGWDLVRMASRDSCGVHKHTNLCSRWLSSSSYHTSQYTYASC
jgi:hypothetical protein